MASILERRTRDGQLRFTALVRLNGYPTRSETFSTRRKAERWAITVEPDMIEGRHSRNVEARRRTLEDAIDRYSSLCAVRR